MSLTVSDAATPAADDAPPPRPHAATDAFEVRATPGAGRGVFATRAISRGTLLEVSPVLVFGADESERHGRHTALSEYVFRWLPAGCFALALGAGSLFNHARRPSVGWTRDFERAELRYTTLRDVAAGEELRISYGPPAALWFATDGEGDGNESDGGGSSSSDEEDPLARLFGVAVDVFDDGRTAADASSAAATAAKAPPGGVMHSRR